MRRPRPHTAQGGAPRPHGRRAILNVVTPARPTAGASDARLADALSPLRSDPSRSAVLLDVDGTLAPIVRYAEEAHVPEGTRSLLIELARRYAVVACVSGR